MNLLETNNAERWEYVLIFMNMLVCSEGLAEPSKNPGANCRSCIGCFGLCSLARLEDFLWICFWWYRFIMITESLKAGTLLLCLNLEFVYLFYLCFWQEALTAASADNHGTARVYPTCAGRPLPQSEECSCQHLCKGIASGQAGLAFHTQSSGYILSSSSNQENAASTPRTRAAHIWLLGLNVVCAAGRSWTKLLCSGASM